MKRDVPKAKPSDEPDVAEPRVGPREGARRVGRALLVAALVVAAVVLSGLSLAMFAPPRQVTQETVRLSISPGAGDQASFAPNAITVHAGALVTFVITNMDPSTSSAPPLAQVVSGVEGNVATYQMTPSAHPRTMASVAPNDISHTFSVDFGSHVLNVPVPPAASPSQPSVVTFQVLFSAVGTFEWYCDSECGSLPMVAPGPMAGDIDVVG